MIYASRYRKYRYTHMYRQTHTHTQAEGIKQNNNERCMQYNVDQTKDLTQRALIIDKEKMSNS